METINKNITIISCSFPDSIRPINGIFVQDQADWLSREVKVKVIAPKPKTNKFLALLNKKWDVFYRIPRFSTRNNYTIYRPEYFTFPRKIFYWMVGWNFSKSVLKKISPKTNIFHIHFAYPSGNVIPQLKKSFPQVPIVLSIHGNDWHSNLENKIIRKQVIKNLISSDRIITVSNHLRNSIVDQCPQLKDKIDVISNGIDISSMPKEVNTGISTFKNRHAFKILMVGAYVVGKGIQVLLSALKDSEIKNYEVIIIGSNMDPEYFNKLLEIRNDYGLSESVEFLMAKPRETIAQYYRDCDCFILPSLKEGFGIVLIEAMHFGKPVVSTKSGGPEDIVNENNGILVKPNNSKELAEALEAMSKNYNKYNSDEIMKYIYENYSSDIIVSKILSVYDKAGW